MASATTETPPSSANNPMNANYDLLDTTQINSLKEFLVSYNKLSGLCFSQCVDDFTSRKASSGEERCVLNCAEKFLKTNQRVSERFQEYQMLTSASDSPVKIAK